MTTAPPPEYYFPGIEFNPDFFEDVSSTLTKKDADARYLIKTEQDTATAIETFTGGIKTNSIESVIDTDTLNIQTVSSTATNIVNVGNATTNNQTLNLNSKTINVGDTTVPSTINIIRPLTIGYTVSPTLINQIGGTTFINGGEQPYSSISATGGSLTLAVLNVIPIGIYQVFYNISTTITVAPALITERAITVSNVGGDTTLTNTFNFMRDSDLLHVTRIVGHDITVTGCGLFINTTSSVSIYLNQRYIYSAGPTVKATGHLRIVRIG